MKKNCLTGEKSAATTKIQLDSVEKRFEDEASNANKWNWMPLWNRWREQHWLNPSVLFRYFFLCVSYICLFDINQQCEPAFFFASALNVPVEQLPLLPCLLIIVIILLLETWIISIEYRIFSQEFCLLSSLTWDSWNNCDTFLLSCQPIFPSGWTRMNV